MTAADDISLLCFRAGDVRLALPSDEVQDIGPPGAGVPHVGSRLGLPAGAAGDAAARQISLASLGGASLAVDGPVGMRSVAARHLARVPSILARDDRPILGFVKDGEALMILLDARRL